jgi:hypothetical protein
MWRRFGGSLSFEVGWLQRQEDHEFMTEWNDAAEAGETAYREGDTARKHPRCITGTCYDDPILWI